jgi:hypothetical protein
MTTATPAQFRGLTSTLPGDLTPANVRDTSNLVRHAMPNPAPDLFSRLVSDGMPQRTSHEITQREHVENPPYMSPVLD